MYEIHPYHYLFCALTFYNSNIYNNATNGIKEFRQKWIPSLISLWLVSKLVIFHRTVENIGQMHEAIIQNVNFNFYIRY